MTGMGRQWESTGLGSSTINSQFPNQERLQSSWNPYPESNYGGGGNGNRNPLNTPSVTSGPPPVPARPVQPLSRNGYSSYNRSIAPYSNGHLGGYSHPYYYAQNPYTQNFPYSRNHGASQFGSLNDQPSLGELAEQSSASAFQSIESFVTAFSSISGMLESTFHAVYSSFRAVVEVADHLGRVKNVFQSLAIFRFLRWMLRRIRYLIGISKIKSEQIELVWNSVCADPAGGEWNEGHHKRQKNASAWPILMFLGFILAGPYLIWKLVSTLQLNGVGDRKWAKGEDDHFIAIAEYDFEPSTVNELRLNKGQQIRLAPATRQPENIKGWVLGSDGDKIGLVPANYIKVIKRVNGTAYDSKLTNPQFTM